MRYLIKERIFPSPIDSLLMMKMEVPRYEVAGKDIIYR